MALVVLSSLEAVATWVAGAIDEQVRQKPASVLGLPAGGTPQPVYAELVRRHREEGLSFAHTSAFGLDEYVGLPSGHPASFRQVVEQAFYRHVDLPVARIHSPDIAAPDLAAASARYEQAIADAGGLDLVVLGIGLNGHVAFNEPGSALDSRTRLVELAAGTRRANAAAFPHEPVPARAVTMGLGTILAARSCLLMACGAGKAPIVARLSESALPAGQVWRSHPRATLVLDQAAASQLPPD